MDGYVDTIENFLSTSTDDIVDRLKEIYPNAEISQVHSWKVLIEDIKGAENIKELPVECVVALEYSLPTDNMAIDCTILGYDSDNQKAAVLIESKQWDDDYISNHSFSVYREDGKELHPQVQISRHKRSFSDYLDVGQDYRAHPIVYIRNCSIQVVDLLIHYNPLIHTQTIPVFNSFKKMIQEAKTVLKSGSAELINELKSAEFRPSKAISDAMSSIINKEEPFLLTDEQEKVLREIKDYINEGKKIIRLTGNAGSGKTAVLLNLYVEYLNSENKDIVPIFISGAQNTAYYRSRYSDVSSSFTYSFSASEMIKQNANKQCVVLMDEAQHNRKGILSEILDSSAILILCYDVKQVISADNPIAELKEIEKRDDYKELELKGSVRFNGSQVAESNIKNYLKGSQHREVDSLFEFCFFEDFSSFQQKIIDVIKTKPESSVAVMGLLSNDAKNFTKEENLDSILFTRWGTKMECEWLPYVYNKDYFKHNNGNIWVGTWWMPGLDVDYVAVIVGGDAKITNNGIEAIPEQAKHYQMMVSVANEHRFPNKLFSEGQDNYTSAQNIIRYINQSGNEKIKKRYIRRFSEYLRNNYYIMMTRGRKGCFVYFANNEVSSEETLD